MDSIRWPLTAQLLELTDEPLEVGPEDLVEVRESHQDEGLTMVVSANDEGQVAALLRICQCLSESGPEVGLFATLTLNMYRQPLPMRAQDNVRGLSAAGAALKSSAGLEPEPLTKPGRNFALK